LPRTRPPSVRFQVAAAAVLLALAGPGLTAAAHAASDMEVGIEDERLALYAPPGSPGELEATVARWRAAGVDVVRLHARWSAIAPDPASATMPDGFRGADPNDPRYYWGALDNAVRLVRANGMRVMLTITGSGPLWSSRAPGRRDPRWKPDPRLFAQFATAVATRYAADVDRYMIWNEPNQQIWLRPQGLCTRSGRTCHPVAPALYRGLVRAAYPAIKAADPTAQVLMGELAPIGRTTGGLRRSLKPLAFLRAMACVDRRLHSIRGGTCRGFRAATADAFGYHPHSVRRAPTQPNRDRDEAQLADLPRLERLLDGLTRRHRLRVAGGGRFALYLTEFGYQTNPPDDLVGVTLPTQARWLQQSAYVAWRDPRVHNLTQYEWEDEPVRESADLLALSGWQSGLFFEDGSAKPSAASFPNPFWVDLRRGASRARFWGQVRPGDGHRVTIQRSAGDAWETVGALDTDAGGYFVVSLPVPERATYRYTYEVPGADPAGPPVTVASATQDVAPR
jgi:hypothetical protein